MGIKYAVQGGYIIIKGHTTFIGCRKCAERWGLEQGEYLAIIHPEEALTLEAGIILLEPDPTGVYDLKSKG